MLANFIRGQWKGQHDEDGRNVPRDVMQLRREDRVAKDNAAGD